MATRSSHASLHNRTKESAHEMRAVISLAFATLALVLVGCNSPSIPPGNYGTVTGTVTSSNGQPVAGVVVYADSGPSGTSGADGHYSIATVPISSSISPTTISITTVPAGYRVPAAQNVQVIAGQTTPNVNFVLQPS
jgi:Carboxypeptidase regulatory-like domain